jgi:hypothetical protein
MDVSSRYVSTEADLLGLSIVQRLQARDWYCINPYLLSGSLNLTRGFPQIHIGDRVRVPGKSPIEDRHYYVEQVGHTWQFGTSIKTALGVTRGWKGTDYSYLAAVKKLAERYEIPEPPPLASV